MKKRTVFYLYYAMLCPLAVFGFYHDQLTELGNITFVESGTDYQLNAFATAILGGVIMWIILVPKILSPYTPFLLSFILGSAIHLHAIVGLVILFVGLERNVVYEGVETLVFGWIAFLLGN